MVANSTLTSFSPRPSNRVRVTGFTLLNFITFAPRSVRQDIVNLAVRVVLVIGNYEIAD